MKMTILESARNCDRLTRKKLTEEMKPDVRLSPDDENKVILHYSSFDIEVPDGGYSRYSPESGYDTRMVERTVYDYDFEWFTDNIITDYLESEYAFSTLPDEFFVFKNGEKWDFVDDVNAIGKYIIDNFDKLISQNKEFCERELDKYLDIAEEDAKMHY